LTWPQQKQQRGHGMPWPYVRFSARMFGHTLSGRARRILLADPAAGYSIVAARTAPPFRAVK